MAEITISGIWMAPADDLANELHLDPLLNVGVSVTEANMLDGEMETMASGRRRSISTDGDTERVQVDLTYATREIRETLKAWRSEFLLYRDYRGRCWFGRMFGFTALEQGGGCCDISFVFDRGTFSIEV